MGWGYGIVQGKEVGYSVNATCEHEGCNEEIDRGLSYACGGMAGEDEYSCNGFFCEEHLINFVETDSGDSIMVCDNCAKILLDSGEWYEDEEEGCIMTIKE
jgi:hypothetical protein